MKGTVKYILLAVVVVALFISQQSNAAETVNNGEYFF